MLLSNANRTSLRRTVAPSSQPFTLDDAREALDMGSDTGSDDELKALISAAVDMVEEHTQRSLMPQTWTLRMDAFPHVIELRRPPVLTVTSVKYLDSTGTEQTVSSSDYYVDIVSAPGRIVPLECWPCPDDRPNAVTVVFTAGYSGSIPRHAWMAIREALKSLYYGCEPSATYWHFLSMLRWGAL